MRERGGHKLIFLALAAAICLMVAFFCSSSADARVKGKCKDCHDMHAPSNGPYPALTKGGCIGCHAQDPAGDKNIIVQGYARTPQILHSMDNGDLAGGNFYYVADGYNPDYAKGHNVVGISAKEEPFSPQRRLGERPMEERPSRLIPPGFEGGAPIKGGYGPQIWPEDRQLTCAGTWGCHGDRTIEDPFKSIVGAHHERDEKLDGSTVGKSFRYLYGVTGAEHKDWEYQATLDSHNGYRGDPAHSATDTISYFCGGCHVTYHPHALLGGDEMVGSVARGPWHAHPTDVAFGLVHIGFAGSDYQEYVTYSLEAPVGFEDPKGNEKFVDQNSIITCMSCHRGHASPFPDSLRWDYSTMVAGAPRSSNTGCFTCHTNQ